jgi:hypothetical protein
MYRAAIQGRNTSAAEMNTNGRTALEAASAGGADARKASHTRRAVCALSKNALREKKVHTSVAVHRLVRRRRWWWSERVAAAAEEGTEKYRRVALAHRALVLRVLEQDA